jgi:hypothetical protein
MVPTSQKYRQIGFVLSGGGDDVRLDLYVRPEDLSRPEPSRLTVQQTLGGAWADSFGRGVSTITLGGTLGWIGNLTTSGEDLFQELRTTVFKAWHDRRAAVAKQGQDPATVSLYYMDSLDTISALVAPESFTLRRSKSSPLLIRYQIVLKVLDDSGGPDSIIDDITNALSNPLKWIAGQAGLGNILTQIGSYVQEAQAVVGSAMTAVTSFVNTGQSLIGAVEAIAGQAEGNFDALQSALLGTTAAFCQAGATAFNVYAADDTLDPTLRISVMALASNFNDAACTCINAFNSEQSFSSYDPLYGASTCSSTAGGDAPSTFTVNGQNPFETWFVPAQAPVTVTAAARAAIAALRADPIPLIGNTAQVAHLMQTAANGITVAPVAVALAA